MAKNRFDIDNIIAVEFRVALCQLKNREERSLIRSVALHLLDATYKCAEPYNETTFTELLKGINHKLTNAQQDLVLDIYMDAAQSYKKWSKIKQARAKHKRAGGTVDYGTPSAHGGASHTGRLKTGFSAPYGTENFQSDDEPREGLKHWVRAVTAGGNGAGYSLGELQGAPARQEYDTVTSPEELKDMSAHELLNIMDNATNPGNFLRAFLSYYNQPMIIALSNTSINSANINNPKNRRSASQLDALYRRMKSLDDESILTNERSLRFLVMCEKIISQSIEALEEPRRKDQKTRDIYRDRYREIKMAKEEVAYLIETICSTGHITSKQMQEQIDSDKRRYRGETSYSLKNKTSNPRPKAHVTIPKLNNG
jgi:DNA repair exonuclease SbcCD nuclease subunit